MARVPKYEPLRAWLAAQTGSTTTVSFQFLDDLVGGLPYSARHHKAYWYGTAAGAPTQVWKRAWEEAGFTIESFDLDREQATFRLL